MKYYIESDCKIPVFTKWWKLSRFAVGMVFGICAVWPTSLFYKKTWPNITTVKKVALRYTWIGVVVNLVLFILSFNHYQ